MRRVVMRNIHPLWSNLRRLYPQSISHGNRETMNSSWGCFCAIVRFHSCHFEKLVLYQQVAISISACIVSHRVSLFFLVKQACQICILVLRSFASSNSTHRGSGLGMSTNPLVAFVVSHSQHLCSCLVRSCFAQIA